MESTLSAETARPGLVVVDDDPLILESLGAAFEDRFEVFCARNQRELRSALRQMPAPPECAIVDLGLPPEAHGTRHGFAAIKEVLAAAPECALVVVSGQDNEKNARLARTMGASDFIAKPASPEKIYKALQLACRTQSAPDADSGFIGDSAAIAALHARIRTLAPIPFPVLIEGETGSGKELAARALHARAGGGGGFLALNCAAVPRELFEATLYGHRRGSFSGAVADSTGYFGDADRGTLLLDEIGELAPELQPKLLRTIETGEYQRIGETVPRRTTARVLAATNRDLAYAVSAGRFRRDLYHRLSVLSLRVPALREMDADRFLLLEHFAAGIAGLLGSERFRLGAAARRLWMSYDFPGNVRELRNIVVRLQARHPGARIGEDELRAQLYLGGALAAESGGLPEFSDVREQVVRMIRAGGAMSLEEASRELRRTCAAAALEAAGGDRAAAAECLGIGGGEFDRALGDEGR